MLIKSSHSQRAFSLGVIGVLVPLLTGCSGASSSVAEPGRELHTTDFQAGPESARVELEADTPLLAMPEPEPASITRDPRVLSIGPSLSATPLAATQDASPRAYLTSPGAPTASSQSAPVSSLTLIDAKVGDINGLPIFAGEFFEPLAAFFIAEGERLPRAEWLAKVRDYITRSLDNIITAELLQAEALSRLSPEQEMGLRALLEDTRERIIGNNLGSVKLAEEKARAERNQSIGDQVRLRRERVLYQLELEKSIFSRVNVSWRDVQQRYLRDYKTWNKDPDAVFRVIRVRKSNAESVEEITRRLEAGEDFALLAAEPLNGFNPAEQGIQITPFEGHYEEGSFFGPAPLNEAARGLEPGELAGPITFGTLVFWVRLESINTQSTSLYEAQLQIEDQIKEERHNAELARYTQRLIKRARVTNREEIIESLYNIAVERFGPES